MSSIRDGGFLPIDSGARVVRSHHRLGLNHVDLRFLGKESSHKRHQQMMSEPWMLQQRLDGGMVGLGLLRNGPYMAQLESQGARHWWGAGLQLFNNQVRCERWSNAKLKLGFLFSHPHIRWADCYLIYRLESWHIRRYSTYLSPPFLPRPPYSFCFLLVNSGAFFSDLSG